MGYYTDMSNKSRVICGAFIQALQVIGIASMKDLMKLDWAPRRSANTGVRPCRKLK